MANHTGPKCRRCRREGEKLFLKGIRCETAKCCFAPGKRSNPPGDRAWRRGKTSAYALQLREKQKLKRWYGVLERQFQRYFEMAERQRGDTGENLLLALERRLDNVAYCLGFAPSRKSSRQLIGHGHMTVNGKKVDIPSYQVSLGDVVKPGGKERSVKLVQLSLEMIKGRTVPSWLQLQESPPEGRVAALPTRDEVSAASVQEQLVVEMCAR